MSLRTLIFLLTFPGLASTFTAKGQQIHIVIEAPPEFKKVELLTYESPFDDNVSLLAELVATTEGKFEYFIPTPDQLRVAFKLGEFSKDLVLTSGYRYEITFEIQRFQKPNPFGDTAQLIIGKIESDNKEFNNLLKIESEIEALKEKNRKGNGKLSSSYANDLFNYWNSLLVEKTSAQEANQVNSKVFSSSLSHLRHLGSANQFKTLENIFQEKFELTVDGLRAMNAIYVADLQIEYFTKYGKKMRYLQFVDQAIEKIINPKLKSALELSLISQAIGRKWANQDSVFSKLQLFITITPFPELRQYAKSVQTLHKSDLIGKRITDFPTLSLQGDTIRFNDFKGKYLLIDFWATWCGPCVKSMRRLPDLKTELESKLEVLCITFEADKDKVNRFVERNNYQDKLAFGFAVNKKLMDSYFDIRAIPLYYLVSPEGIIIDKAIGEPFEMVKRHIL